MKSKIVIGRQTLQKQVPYLNFTLSPQEARELYQSLGSGTCMTSKEIYRQLEEYLSEYDTGKYDTLTLIKEEE